MREIKFRAQRTDNNEFVYGSLLQSEIDINEMFVEAFICERFANEAELNKINVKPETVSEYSGIGDINGQPIYEHDKLKCFIKGKQIGAIDEVEFKFGCFWLKRRYVSMSEFISENDGEFEIVTL